MTRPRKRSSPLPPPITIHLSPVALATLDTLAARLNLPPADVIERGLVLLERDEEDRAVRAVRRAVRRRSAKAKEE